MNNSWDEIDSFRGSLVNGKWPTVPELFTMAVKRYPENTCFSIFEPKEKKEISYSKAYSIILQIASYLRDKGIRKGDKVVLNGKNGPCRRTGFPGR